MKPKTRDEGDEAGDFRECTDKNAAPLVEVP